MSIGKKEICCQDIPIDLEPTPSAIIQSGDDKHENCGSKREMRAFTGYAALL